jgi:hypothetical protein
MIEKYIQTQDLVNRLTNDPTFKTFFTIYLTAENEAERDALNNRFWIEVDKLPSFKKQTIEAEFKQCFIKLPMLAAQLVEKAGYEFQS